MRTRVSAVAALLVASLLVALPASAAGPPVSTSPPTVSGQPVYHGLLVADHGAWESDTGHTYSYRWLRAGVPIRGAHARRYRPQLDDLRQPLRVEVTATDELGESGTALSGPTSRVRRATFDTVTRPRLAGTRRYPRVLEADAGRWEPRRHRTGYRWFRDGRPIKGATGRRYRLDHRDVGHRVRVRVSVRRDGYRVGRSFSRRTRPILHRVPARRTATYRIETRGDITASRRAFRRQVAETFADPRGWRSAGVVFRRVARGGDFSVVLAEASRVPGFSPVCSARWSCRVGRYVVINQQRWLHATPSWNRAHEPLRGYRHMVLDHETGHWLGHGHLGCPGRGRPAPVMMQQSKGLDGCRHNPWPLPSELWYR